MPAVSKKQRKAAGIARAIQKGTFPARKAGPAAAQMAQMAPADLAKFAKTTERGLPTRSRGGSRGSAATGRGSLIARARLGRA